MIVRYQSSARGSLRAAVMVGLLCLVLFLTFAIEDEYASPDPTIVLPFFAALCGFLLPGVTAPLVRGVFRTIYLVSDKTLAIRRPGKPTRFYRRKDLQAFYPDSQKFVLQSGEKIRMRYCAWPGNGMTAAESLIARWFGKEMVAECRAAHREAGRLSRLSWALLAIAAVTFVSALIAGIAGAPLLNFLGIVFAMLLSPVCCCTRSSHPYLPPVPCNPSGRTASICA